MANLSQAEIDALLNGGAPSAEPDPIDVAAEMATAEAAAKSKPITAVSQAEGEDNLDDIQEVLGRLDKSDEYLTPDEKDILGEIGNICMGASATTMYTLLGHKVTITTPRVHVYTSDEVISVYRSPFVVVKVEYRDGVKGKNLLILKERDSVLITNLLMGEESEYVPGTPLDELHLSAMSEIMNQMIGASATSLSKMLGTSIDITPPEAIWVGEHTDVSEFLDGSQLTIKVSFNMEIEGILKSELMQIMSIETGKKLVGTMIGIPREGDTPPPAPPPPPPPIPSAPPPMPSFASPTPPPVPSFASAPPPPPVSAAPAYTVNVQPASYTAFDEQPAVSPAALKTEAVGLLGDIPLQVTVELGKTKKSINDILNMGIGSVIVLDKMAGELVEVVVNGKRIARGEVVVIDENYGVRITDIISKDDNI